MPNTKTKLIKSALEEFDKKFIKHKMFAKGVWGFESDDFKDFLSKQITLAYKEGRKEVVDTVNDELDSLEVDLVETTSQEYDNGWNECNLQWDLKIIHLQKYISQLKEKHD